MNIREHTKIYGKYLKLSIIYELKYHAHFLCMINIGEISIAPRKGQALELRSLYCMSMYSAPAKLILRFKGGQRGWDSLFLSSNRNLDLQFQHPFNTVLSPSSPRNEYTAVRISCKVITYLWNTLFPPSLKYSKCRRFIHSYRPSATDILVSSRLHWFFLR